MMWHVGVIKRPVEPPESIQRYFNHFLDNRLEGDIRMDEHARAAVVFNLATDAIWLFLEHIGDEDKCAFRSEQFPGSLTYTTRTACRMILSLSIAIGSSATSENHARRSADATWPDENSSGGVETLRAAGHTFPTSVRQRQPYIR